MNAPPLPSGPGVLVIVTAVVAVVAVCFFGFWALGGYKRWIPDHKVRTLGDVLRPSLAVVAVMAAAVLVFLAAVWFEDRQREAALDRYDHWLRHHDQRGEQDLLG